MGVNLKKILRRIMYTVIFFAGLIVILLVSSYIFTPKSNKGGSVLKPSYETGLLGENKDTIDAVIIGDSEAYSAYSPMLMWKNNGITSYVCSTAAQQLYWSDNFLHEAFEKQKPKVVILETNAIFRKMTYADTSANRISNMFSIFRYHDRWKDMKLKSIGRKADYSWTDDNKGFRCSSSVNGVRQRKYMKYTDKTRPLPDINRRYVSKMAEYCRKNGAELVLVSTPSSKNWNYQKHNAIERLAKEQKIKYVDLNLISDQLHIDWLSDTRDRGDHLNYTGATKVSDFMGNYLAENFKLKDHRNDKAYSKWNSALQRYLLSVQK
ncbi:MAG: hypothetical protein LKG21_05530 [Ruminococcus sp.]|jgi:hypothetical protein|nr:hypothetical protein [Ruminococcus sp.]